MTRQAVFLDRDGVLNRAIVIDGKPYPPASLEKLEILPGVDEACRDLRLGGFLLVMVSNQPDVARGNQSQEVVDEINQAISARLMLDAVKICCHDDAHDCECRKPKPGLLSEAAQEMNIDLSMSFMIGDRWKDIEAGRRAGCKTVLIQSGYLEKKASGFDYEATSLRAATDWILSRTI